MKKLYTIALAVAAVLSMNAAERVQKSDIALPLRNLSIVDGVKSDMTLNSVMKAPAAVAAQDVAGEYVWTGETLLNGDGMLNSIVDVVVKDATSGAAEVYLGDGYVLTATIDAAAGTLSIPNNQLVGKDSDGDIYFYIKDVNSEGKLVAGKSNAAATVGVIKEGFITFPELDVWALGDYNNEALGWYNLSAYNVFEPNVWEDLGEATFVDGIWSPMFGITTPATSQVLVQRNGKNPGEIRVLNAWLATYKTLGVQSQQTPAFVIDITDPEFVTVALQATGVSTQQEGSVYIISFNSLAKKDDFLAGNLKDRNITLTDGVINFPGNAVGCVFSSDPENVYSAKNPLSSTLTLPAGWDNSGVANVEISNNAPVEYYNLQGVRVANPESGIYIRRQGSKATKVLVK